MDTVCVDVVRADDARPGVGGDAAHEKGRDVEALPRSEVVAEDDGGLGVEVGDAHGAVTG